MSRKNHWTSKRAKESPPTFLLGEPQQDCVVPVRIIQIVQIDRKANEGTKNIEKDIPFPKSAVDAFPRRCYLLLDPNGYRIKINRDANCEVTDTILDLDFKFSNNSKKTQIMELRTPKGTQITVQFQFLEHFEYFKRISFSVKRSVPSPVSSREPQIMPEEVEDGGEYEQEYDIVDKDQVQVIKEKKKKGFGFSRRVSMKKKKEKTGSTSFEGIYLFWDPNDIEKWMQSIYIERLVPLVSSPQTLYERLQSFKMKDRSLLDHFKDYFKVLFKMKKGVSILDHLRQRLDDYINARSAIPHEEEVLEILSTERYGNIKRVFKTEIDNMRDRKNYFNMNFWKCVKKRINFKKKEDGEKSIILGPVVGRGSSILRSFMFSESYRWDVDICTNRILCMMMRGMSDRRYLEKLSQKFDDFEQEELGRRSCLGEKEYDPKKWDGFLKRFNEEFGKGVDLETICWEIHLKKKQNELRKRYLDMRQTDWKEKRTLELRKDGVPEEAIKNIIMYTKPKDTVMEQKTKEVRDKIGEYEHLFHLKIADMPIPLLYERFRFETSKLRLKNFQAFLNQELADILTLGKYGMSALKVKLVLSVSRKKDLQINKPLQYAAWMIGPFGPVYGLLHAGLLIGNVAFDWLSGSFVNIRLKSVGGSYEHIAAFDCMCPLVVSRRDTLDVVRKLSKEIVEVNMSGMYQVFGGKLGRRVLNFFVEEKKFRLEKGFDWMNCQDFCTKILGKLGCFRFFPQVNEYIDDLKGALTELKDVDEETVTSLRFFRPSKEFTREFNGAGELEDPNVGMEFAKNKFIFRSHAKLDVFLRMLKVGLMNEELERTKLEACFPGEFHLLKGFDRAFWIMSERKDLTKEERARCRNNDNCPLCQFYIDEI